MPDNSSLSFTGTWGVSVGSSRWMGWFTIFCKGELLLTPLMFMAYSTLLLVHSPRTTGRRAVVLTFPTMPIGALLTVVSTQLPATLEALSTSLRFRKLLILRHLRCIRLGRAVFSSFVNRFCRPQSL